MIAYDCCAVIISAPRRGCQAHHHHVGAPLCCQPCCLAEKAWSQCARSCGRSSRSLVPKQRNSQLLGHKGLVYALYCLDASIPCNLPVFCRIDLPCFQWKDLNRCTLICWFIDILTNCIRSLKTSAMLLDEFPGVKDFDIPCTRSVSLQQAQYNVPLNGGHQGTQLRSAWTVWSV